MNLQSEIAPMEDKSNVRFSISTPEGSSFQYTQDVSDQVTNFLNDSIPEKDFVFNAVPAFGGNGGTNSSIARIGLVSPENRIKTQDEIAKILNKKMGKFNNARVFGIQEQTISVGLGSRGSLPVQFVIQNIDFAKIKEAIPEFLEAARNDKTFQNVDVNLKFNKPEILMTFDRIKIKDLALTTQDVVSAVQGAFSGRRLAYFTMNGRQYEVIAQVEREDRTQPTDINNLYVTNTRGERIPLSAVVKLEESSNPPSLYHFNRLKAATISASLSEGKTIGDGVQAMQRIGDKVLDKTFQTALSGPSRDYSESSSNTAFAFGLALALIYLLLAAQFESFKDPFTIMITVPLALAGALGSLWIFGQTLNIFSQIGMIMLIGLVTKNGILIVEFANHKRAEGFSKFDAVVEASAQRLRPILMTSLATSLGALPIALSLGAASTSRVPLGTVVVGGILFSLILTLLVIPAVYTYFSSKNYITEESKLAKEEEENTTHVKA
jgi:HAE1 family hydrophobic/amphiphilic exporter-1/multidrug efflux pump